MDEEKTAELIQAFKQASPRTLSLSRDVIREGLLAVLAIVEQEHVANERERVKPIIEKLARDAYVAGGEAVMKAMFND